MAVGSSGKSLDEILSGQARRLRTEIEKDKPLSRLSTLGVGGRVECYLEPACLDDFQTAFEMSHSYCFPIYIIGGGSNIVAADGRVSGVVLSTRGWDGASWDNNCVSVNAGCPLSKLAKEAEERGLGGLEFAVGIPGTVGGALSGNAGAGGKVVCDLLTELTTIEPDGSIKKWNRDEFSYSYRHFSLAGKGCEGRFFVECRLELSPKPKEEIAAERERFMGLRASQPANECSAECSFKNPPGDSAGRMLDKCGCKGMTAGGAAVSERHANFIVNRGDASASDVVSLMKSCRERVFEEFGVRLEPELRFLGFEPF